MESQIKEFDGIVHRIVLCLEKGDDNAGKELFVNELEPKFSSLMHSSKRHPLEHLRFFYFDLKDFLLNESWRATRKTTRNDLVNSYYSDYQEDLKVAIKDTGVT